jgi:hypothetical protein
MPRCEVAPPNPSSSEEGSPRIPPPWIRRGRGGSFLDRSFVFIDILALFPHFSMPQSRFHAKVSKSHHPPPLLIRGGEPENSPPWIRRGQGWLIAESFLCFHRHSRIVRRILGSKSREVEEPSHVILPHQQQALPGRSEPLTSLCYWAQFVKRLEGNGSIQQGNSEFRRPNGAGRT